MKQQSGFFLIEALIAILIFSLAVLGIVGMGGAAIASQSDARFRTDAANLANDIASHIQLNVNRTSLANLRTSLDNYQHQPAGVDCSFSGPLSLDPGLQLWLNKVVTVGPGLPGLPGTTSATQQVLVDTTPGTGFNRVQITICWRAPNDTALRKHMLVTYVNPQLIF
jgi:type IV pilus assembly protein PilV